MYPLMSIDVMKDMKFSGHFFFSKYNILKRHIVYRDTLE